jgi:hypothetical protein
MIIIPDMSNTISEVLANGMSWLLKTGVSSLHPLLMLMGQILLTGR